MMNKNEWKKVKLEDVCDILDNKRIPITASKRKKGVYPYYGANGIQDYVDDYIFDDELILLAEDGGNFGSKTKPIAYRVSGKCWVNNHAHVLKAKENFMISDFLCYSLMFYDVTKIINGATRLKLTQSAMRNMLVPLPELREQEKIVKKLQCIEEILKKKKEQIKYLENLVKFQFLKMFGDPILNEKNWNMSSFGNNFKISSGGTPSTQKNEYWENGNISWIGSNMCQDKIIYKSDGKFITELGYNNSSAKIFKENTILVALVGATIGKTALLKFETTTNQNVAGIEIINNDFIPEFVFYLLQKLYVKFQNLGNGNFKMANLTFIKGLPLIIPPIELQNKFADFVKQVDKSKVILGKALKSLSFRLNYYYML